MMSPNHHVGMLLEPAWWLSRMRIRLVVRWSGDAKMSCISRHRGVQLILAYSWARPAIFVAGKGRGGMFFLLLLFLHFHSSYSFFPVPRFHLFYLFSPFLWETTQNDQQNVVKPHHNQVRLMVRSGRLRSSLMMNRYHIRYIDDYRSIIGAWVWVCFTSYVQDCVCVQRLLVCIHTSW